jgi:hypothetical protein
MDNWMQNYFSLLLFMTMILFNYPGFAADNPKVVHC